MHQPRLRSYADSLLAKQAETGMFGFFSSRFYRGRQAVHAKSLQLCLTLCDPMDHSLSDYSALGIPQARILSWAVPIIRIHTVRNTSEVDKLRYWAVKECKCPLKREKKWKVKVAPLCAPLFVTPWTIPSMGFSRPEYWSGWSCPSSGDLPNPGTQPRPSTFQVDSLPAEPPRKPKNTRVGSLSLLQRIFSIQELNQGLLHCKQILYQLSYHEVPLKRCTAKIANNPKVIFLIWLCQVCICTYVLICVHVGRALLLSLHIYIFLTVASNDFT